MAITKITKNAFPASIDLSSVDLTIGNDEIVTANIADNNVTHAKLHTDMDLSSKTVTLPSGATLGSSTNGLFNVQGGSSTSPQIRFFDGGTARARIGVPTGQTYLSLSGSDTLTADAVITAAGNVGIGNANPQSKLEVWTGNGQLSHFGSNNANASGNYTGISLGYAESGNNSYRKVAIVAAGLGDGAARQDLHFLLDNNADGNSVDLSDSKMVIKRAGQVGIGTSSPTQQLNVHADDSRIEISTNQAGTTKTQLQFTTDRDGTPGYGFVGLLHNNGSRLLRIGTNGNSGTDYGIQLDASNNVHIRQNVGIGTDSPTNVKLQLNKSGSDTVGDGHIGFGGGSTPLWAIRGGALDFDLRIDRAYGGWQSTPALSIRRSNGNVGIGLDTASTKLHVKSGGAGNSYGSLYLEIDTATNYPAMVIQTATGGNYTETHGLYIKNTAAGYGLRIDDTSGDTSPFVVDTEGRVGVGTTSPVSSVDIGYGTNGGWEGASSTPALAITQSDAYRGIALRTVGSSNIPATLSLERAQASGAQTSDGDDLGRVMWNGSSGSYVNRIGASIRATQHGAYSGGYIPAKLDFLTSSTTLTHNGQNPASGAHASRFRINPAGDYLINGQFNFHVISGTSSPNVAFSYDFYRATYAHPMKITCAISHWNGGYMSYTEGWYWGYNTVMSSTVLNSYNGGNGSWTISFPTNNIVRVRMNGDASYAYGSGWFIKVEGNLRREYTSA